MRTWPPCRRAHTRMVPSAGEYLAALSRRLTKTCSISTASTQQERQLRVDVDLDVAVLEQRLDAARARRRRSSRRSTQSACGCSAPRPSRVMSSRFWTKRFEALGLLLDGLRRARAAPLPACPSASARSGWSAAPMIDTSGVLRSWESDDSSADAQPLGFRREVRPPRRHRLAWCARWPAPPGPTSASSSAALLWRRRLVIAFHPHAKHAERSARRLQRQEQPARPMAALSSRGRPARRGSRPTAAAPRSRSSSRSSGG